MDEFEKKIGEFYQARKREDEKAIPAFDAIMNRQRQSKHQAKLYRITRLKIAASIIGVVVALSYYFAHVSPVKQPAKMQSIPMPPILPSESLLKEKLGTKYIWQWKSGTDQLVEDARQLTKAHTQANKLTQSNKVI